jgi:hypothetical protein
VEKVVSVATVFVVNNDEGFLEAIFTERSFAESSFPSGKYEIEERELHAAIVEPWIYWHRGASVYPDGTYEEWEKESKAEGEVGIPACDDHLNSRDEPWDGHTQSHCGEHISIFGTDRELVEAAFRKHLAKAIARQDGCCKSSWKHHHGDGKITYETDWHGGIKLSTMINASG